MARPANSGQGSFPSPRATTGIPSRTRSRSGVTTVTGSPSASTRRGRSRRSHFETRLGNVEMTISSNSPSATARRIASNASCSPVRPSTGPPAARSSGGGASSRVQSVCSDFGASGMAARRRSLARAPAAGCDQQRGRPAVRFATTSDLSRVWGLHQTLLGTAFRSMRPSRQCDARSTPCTMQVFVRRSGGVSGRRLKKRSDSGRRDVRSVTTSVSRGVSVLLVTRPGRLLGSGDGGSPPRTG